MGSYTILIGLSIAVILSYLFNLAAKATKIPSVLMLLLTGIALKQMAEYTNFGLGIPKVVLEIFGIIGLIMIVLEGALDLKLSRDKAPLIRRSFVAATIMLVVQSVAIAVLLQLYVGAPFQSCLVNAVPLAVVSSAVAIPSVASLVGEKQEFIIYESTFSDIIGILFFNFAIQDNFAQGTSILTFSRDVIAVLIVAVVSTAVLTFLLSRITLHIKFFLIFAFLILLYSLAKELHLSSLVLVLAFGLAVNNAELFLKGRLREWFHPERLASDLDQFKNITGESAFLIRTFFFLLFGFSINLNSIINLTLLEQGLLIVGILTLIRYVFLRYVAKTDLMPELFIAPKGLITILLFYSIPPQHFIGEVSESILFVVILLTGLLMMVGLIITPKQPELGEY